MIGASVLGGLAAIAGLGPLLLTHDPLARDLDGGLTAIGGPLPPSWQWLLGTDQLGRDVWARLVAATATSLEVAALATVIGLAIGLTVGLAAATGSRRIDQLLMRIVDLVLAFPVILVVILLAALLRETQSSSSIAPIAATLGVVGWTTLARVIRGKARALAHSEFFVAARAMGATPWRIATHHMLPNLRGVIAAMTALLFAQNLIAESVLSYLGLGPPPPAPTWGRMLFEGRAYYRTAPWLIVAPTVAILIAVMAANVLGEALRDSSDPQSPW